MALRDRTRSLISALAASTALAAGCTVFDGKTVPGDAGADAGPADATSPPPVDAPPSTQPVRLASGGYGYLALGPDSVYFTSPDKGTVMRVAKSGSASTVVVGGQGDPNAIAVDGANLFWVNSTPPSVRTCAATGCASAQQLATSASFPYGLTTDTQSVYWLVSDAHGSLEKVDKSGAGRQTLASNQGYGQWVATDEVNVYFTNAGDGTVNRLRKTDGALQALAGGESAPHGIAIDGANVYFTSHGSGSVKRVSKTGSAITELARGQKPEAIATDGVNVYWANSIAGGSIQRCSVQGGSVTTLATGQAEPFGIAVDGAEVFWVNAGDGAVMKVAK